MQWVYNIISALINVYVVISFKILCNEHALSADAVGAIRNSFGMLAIMPLILVHLYAKPKEFKTNIRYGTNVVLGLIGGASMALWPMVFVNMETHIAMTFAFALPFLANIMFVIFCKEKVPYYAWIVKVISLFGVMIIMRPQLAGWGIYHTLGIACVVLWSISAVLTKISASSKSSLLVSVYFYIIFGTIGTVIFSIPALKSVDYSLWPWFLLIGAVNSVGNVFMFLAFRHGSGYLVQLMEFLKFVIIIFLDVTLFNSDVTIYTITGSTIVIIAILSLVIKQEFFSKKVAQVPPHTKP